MNCSKLAVYPLFCDSLGKFIPYFVAVCMDKLNNYSLFQSISEVQ